MLKMLKAAAKFVQIVIKYPCLYNSYLKDYASKNITQYHAYSLAATNNLQLLLFISTYGCVQYDRCLRRRDVRCNSRSKITNERKCALLIYLLYVSQTARYIFEVTTRGQ